MTESRGGEEGVLKFTRTTVISKTRNGFHNYYDKTDMKAYDKKHLTLQPELKLPSITVNLVSLYLPPTPPNSNLPAPSLSPSYISPLPPYIYIYIYICIYIIIYVSLSLSLSLSLYLSLSFSRTQYFRPLLFISHFTCLTAVLLLIRHLR